MATSSSEDCSVILACVDMNHFKYNTDGLGGHYGLACSLELGVARGVTKHRFNLLFLSLIVMCMRSPMSLQIPLHSLILNIQRSNELYKNIKFSYIRRLKIYQNIFFSNLLVLILLTSDLILWGVRNRSSQFADVGFYEKNSLLFTVDELFLLIPVLYNSLHRSQSSTIGDYLI